MTPAYIIWNAEPVIFEIGALTIRWYGIIFGTGFILTYLLMGRIFILEKCPNGLLDKLGIYIFVATFAGGRLGHCLLYEPEIYLAAPVRILFIWEGGLASHGAALFILVALILFAKRYKINIWWLFDRVAILIPIVAASVRIGNLMNSEIIGKISSAPWSFIFTKVDSFPRHPVQLYEALAYLAIFIWLIILYIRKRNIMPKGLISAYFLISLFTARFVLEFFKAQQTATETYMFLNMGQILSIPLIILGLIFLYWSLKNAKLRASQ